MTIAMTHESQKYGPMLVHALVSGCGCEYSVPVSAKERMGNDLRALREQMSEPDWELKEASAVNVPALKKPKQWYRYAENVLLSTGKVVMRNRGDLGTSLECKEHKR